MKILQIHPSMGLGGIESMIQHLANESGNCGHDVTVCSIFKPEYSDASWNNLSSKINKISLNKTIAGFSIKELFKIYAVIKQGKYDIVHLHGFMYYYMLAILFLHRRARFIYTVHSDAHNENTYWDKRFFFIKKLFFKLKWVQPVTISDVSESSFFNLYGFHAKTIYNGISQGKIASSPNLIDTYRFSPYTKIFFHPARITKAKNQEMLCQAFSALIAKKKDIVLLIAGSIQDEAIFRRISKYFSERIIYLGPRNDITELLSRTDAFCLSSSWEGLPVSLLEALSVACIPICTPVGGIRNVITDGINGLLSKSVETKDYIDVIEKFINMHLCDIAALKAQCMSSFKKYDISITTQKYIQLYKKAL